MQNPLNESQRELLSAYLDGEVSAAEKQTATELLQREDAQAYLESLRATVKLVTDNAPVHAPVGLSGRVMDSLKDEVKQTVHPGSEPFTALPRISWQAPIWAAAAAIVVSVAIMFGPTLFNSKPQGPAIASDVLDNLPTRESITPPVSADGGVSEKPEGTNGDLEEREADMPKKLAEHERAFGESSKLGKNLENLKAEKDLADEIEDEVAADPTDSPADKYSRRTGEEAEKKSNEDPGSDALREEASGAAEGGESRAGKKEEGNWDGGASGGGRGGKTAKSKDAEQGASPPEPQPRRNRDDGRNELDDSKSEPNKGESAPDTADRESRDVKRAKGDVVPPSAPAEEPSGDARPGNEAPKQDAAIELKLTEGDSLAAQTDVLWISKLYGDAKIAEGDEDVESIEIEVDADKLPELMAALRKLANEQGYGAVEGMESLGRVEQDEPETESAEDGTRGISGYLPVEEEREQQEPGLQSETSEKVKLVVRMK